MLQRAKTRLFPLHLAPIDHFFCQDDRPDYPMAFTCHLAFSGEIQRDAFEPALVEALSRHPLLQALIKPAKANKPCWVSANGKLPVVHWGQIGESFEFSSTESIDLAREVGLRIWVRTNSDESEVLFQFHHACTDGTGAYRFIGDLLAEYGLRTALELKDRPVVELCDQELLKNRRSKMAGVVADVGWFLGTKRAVGHAFSVFRRRIAPLARNSESDYDSFFQNSSHSYPGIELRAFNKAQYKSLRDHAGQNNAMLNDLLVSEMFLTIRDWNHRNGDRRRRWLRIMMPTDLREKQDITMPAANMTAYSFITRSTSDCESPSDLLKSVRNETLRIKHEKSGKRFVDAVMLAQNHVPAIVPFLLNRNRCLATVILSNVGDPSRRFLARFPRSGGKLRAGNLLLESISGVPPLRPLSRATVSIVTYGRELVVNIRCDPKSMSPADARAFVDLYAGRLEQHIVAQAPVEDPEPSLSEAVCTEPV